MFTHDDDEFVDMSSDCYYFIKKRGLGCFMEVVLNATSRYEDEIRTDIKKEYEDRLNQLEKDNKDVVAFAKNILHMD